MKKIKTMRIASILLIAVLMTTCAISGTFAKYVTSADATDTARVAKWGVNITATGVTFAKNYDDTVITTADVKVVAPGTAGDMAAINITGTPEVSVVINYDATLTLDGWAVTGDDFYCPIVIVINDGKTNEVEVSGLGYNSASDFAAAVKAKVQAYSQTYEPNTDLDSKDTDNLTISWYWAFEEQGVINSYDTELGNKAADGNASTIKLDVVVTVTQVD